MADLSQDEKDVQEALAAGGSLVAAPGPLMKQYGATPDTAVGGLQPWQRPAQANQNGPLPWLVAGGAKAADLAGHVVTRHPLEIAATLYGLNKARGMFRGRPTAAPAEATAVRPPSGPTAPRLPAGVTTVSAADKAKFPKELKHFEVGDEIERKELTALKMGRTAPPAPAPAAELPPAPVAELPAAPPAAAEAVAAERAMTPTAPEAPPAVRPVGRPITTYGRPGGPVTTFTEAEGKSGPELARTAAAIMKATGRETPLTGMAEGAANTLSGTIIPALPFLIQLLQGKSLQQHAGEAEPITDPEGYRQRMLDAQGQYERLRKAGLSDAEIQDYFKRGRSI